MKVLLPTMGRVNDQATDFPGSKPEILERIKKYCGPSVGEEEGGGLFGFWLRFGSVTGLCKPAPSPKPRQNPKILAPNGHIIF